MLQLMCFAVQFGLSSVGPMPLSSPVPHVPALMQSMNAPQPGAGQAGASAPAATRRVRVQFGRGRSSATLAGQVQGYDTVDYVLKANAQQRLTVRLTSQSRFLVIGIYAPDGEEICVETCTAQWTGMLPRMGDYTVRVGLVRAEARRQKRAAYTLNVSVTSP